MSDEQSIKRKKSYYLKAAKGKRFKHGHVLEPGLKGFFITCNNREKEAVREAYNILNEYADELPGKSEIPVKDGSDGDNDIKVAKDDAEEDEEEDIAAALQKEVSAIKNKTSSERRFQVVDSGANNCIFIKTTLEQPDELIHKLFSDLHESQKCKSRFIMRLMPVVGTCRADEENLNKLGLNVLPRYFEKKESKTYCVIVKIRNNNKFGKTQILPVLREIIQELNPAHDFDPDTPDYIISIDVVKTVCCMSIMKDFFKFRKYNMQEVVKVSVAPPQKVKCDKDDDVEKPESKESDVEVKNSSVDNEGETKEEKDENCVEDTSVDDKTDHEKCSTSVDAVNMDKNHEKVISDDDLSKSVENT